MNEKIKIAIADDHLKVAKVLEKLLEDKGFKVIIEARSGEDLIQQIENSSIKPDLCIVDYKMSPMNGGETCKVLKYKWPSIQIIGFSMDADNGEVMLNMGADAFLIKSSPTEQIIDTVKRSMGIV